MRVRTEAGDLPRRIAMMRPFLLLLAAHLTTCPAAALPSSPEPVEVTVLNGARVYHPVTLGTGDKLDVTRFGTVVSHTIFSAIPEYQEVKRRNLDPASAEYAIFMKKASDRFAGAIARTAQAGAYELIAEVGAIQARNATAPDITSEVLRNL
jgi:predicted amino acid dehydrogenase